MSDARGHRIRGHKSLAAHINVGESAVVAYTRLPEDPLPIRVNVRHGNERRGEPWCWSVFLDEWVARRNGGVLADGTRLKVLQGWLEICALLGGIDPDTAQRWARLPHDRLPVYGIRGHLPSRQGPWAYESALRDWMMRGDLPYQAHDRLRVAETPTPPRPKRRPGVEVRAVRRRDPATDSPSVTTHVTPRAGLQVVKRARTMPPTS